MGSPGKQTIRAQIPVELAAPSSLQFPERSFSVEEVLD